MTCVCRRPSWIPKTQPNGSSAVVWLSFWFSTRFTRKKLDHCPGIYLYSLLHYLIGMDFSTTLRPVSPNWMMMRSRMRMKSYSTGRSKGIMYVWGAHAKKYLNAFPARNPKFQTWKNTPINNWNLNKNFPNFQLQIRLLSHLKTWRYIIHNKVTFVYFKLQVCKVSGESKNLFGFKKKKVLRISFKYPLSKNQLQHAAF